MTDEEKILKFAGFEKHGLIKEWYYPDGTCHATMPDTTDLTWLFKWCVPKLDYIDLMKGEGKHSFTAEAGILRPQPPQPRYLDFRKGNGPTAGEALRSAIVALIRDV